MAQRRSSIRKAVEILRLKHELGLTNRQIARSGGLSHPTVSRYLERAEEAGLAWPLPENLDEEQLQKRLFAEDGDTAVHGRSTAYTSVGPSSAERSVRPLLSRGRATPAGAQRRFFVF